MMRVLKLIYVMDIVEEIAADDYDYGILIQNV
jgi:hypothetical protein